MTRIGPLRSTLPFPPCVNSASGAARPVPACGGSVAVSGKALAARLAKSP